MATSVTTVEGNVPAKAQPVVQVDAPSRREFLYYIWGASIALLLGQVSAGLIWFALPRFRAGEFGGVFNVPAGDIPAPGDAPLAVSSGRFWVSNVPDQGIQVLYGVCTHLGCLPKWVPTNGRFECPCHGSKFEMDGKYIEGPAPVSLDRFRSTVIFTDGSSEEMSANGDPIPLNGRTVQSVAVNTGARVKRGSRN
jgi:cytochrome b6-f complex iron-sulfur subunit